MAEVNAHACPGFVELVAMGLPAMACEAAPYLSIALQTALLAHSGCTSSVHAVAAFAAVNTTIDFISGLFNFLFMVVLANVGRAVGRKDWVAVGARVRSAFFSAVILGVLAGSLVSGLRVPVFRLMKIDGAENEVSGGKIYYFLRASCIPAYLVHRVSLGALGGYQRLGTITSLNVGRALFEVLGCYLVLHVGKVSSITDHLGPLGVVGVVTFFAQYCTSFIGLLLVICLRPHGSTHRVRVCVRGFGFNVHGTRKEYNDEDDGAESWSGALQFYRDARDTIVRSLCLQVSVWLLAVCAAQLGTSALAAHQVLLLLWMLTSYIVDGFADVGTMIGSKMLGAEAFHDFKVLTKR